MLIYIILQWFSHWHCNGSSYKWFSLQNGIFYFALKYRYNADNINVMNSKLKYKIRQREIGLYLHVQILLASLEQWHFQALNRMEVGHHLDPIK